MKYRIEVKVMAEVTYTVEVDESSEQKAEDAACAMWRTELPSDFQVEKGYITDWVIEKLEQLTVDCERCNEEYPLPTTATPVADHLWNLCPKCVPIAEAEHLLETAKAGVC